MNKIILGTLLAVSLVISAQPVIADCEPSFTGGGIIMDGKGKDALKITFATNIFYDDESLPVGVIHFNFHNTNSGFLDGGTFFSKEINKLDFDPRNLDDTDDGEFLFVTVEATGQFDGEDNWRIYARFADFSGSNNKKNGSLGAYRDAARIQVFDPDGNHVYDTAWLEDLSEDPPRPSEFTRDQVWRAFIDGGIVTVHCFEYLP